MNYFSILWLLYLELVSFSSPGNPELNREGYNNYQQGDLFLYTMLSSNEERSEYTMETRRVHHGNIMDNTASWNTRYYRIYYGIESHHGGWNS